MLYTLTLSLHLGVAFVTAVFSVLTATSLWNKEVTKYSRRATQLGLCAGFEVFTGTLLSVLSPNVTALSLCSNIALYLSIVFVLEYALFVRMKEVATFPYRFAFVPVVASLSLFVLTLSSGL